MAFGINKSKLSLSHALNQFGFAGLGGSVLPPPPFLVASNGSILINSISGLTYKDGTGPSNSSGAFGIFANGLDPAIGTITLTPSANIELTTNGGSSWTSSPVSFAYAGAAVSTAYVYAVRLKAGLTPDTYSETLVISGQMGINVPDWTINIQATVTPALYIIATGGVETRNGNYIVRTFASSDDLVISQLSDVGAYNDIKVLVVAGGSGGDYSSGAIGGGGGAGGVIYNSAFPIAVIGTYPCITGNGGAGGGPAGPGGNSTFDSLTAIGGGSGGITDGYNGGSGGGAGNFTLTTSNGGVGVVGQGHNGGNSGAATRGGGGGGAGAAGANSIDDNGGDGGIGISCDITGAAVYYGGGGGGAGIFVTAVGGLGGGGNGIVFSLSQDATPGVDGTGGGGGGGGGTFLSKPGGSGIVIISYYSPL